MLEKFDVSADSVRECLRHGDPLLFIELQDRHEHDWSLFKARGALRFDNNSLDQHLTEIPHDRPIVVFSDCPGDETSALAAQMLQKRGWDNVHKLVGGFDAYLDAGLPVEPVSRAIPATRIMML